MRIFPASVRHARFAMLALLLLAASCRNRGQETAAGAVLPELSGATAWLNSPPLTREQLKGKVVLVDFWTYSCINCLRSLPYMKMWDAKYRDQGLVVIGVHAPEFDFEKNRANVEKALRKFGVTYPVAMDNDLRIWSAFDNHYWPAHYFIDSQGRIRHTHFGEGEYDESEQWIVKLLAERNKNMGPAHAAEKNASAIEEAGNFATLGSPETYVGYERAERFASPHGLMEERAHSYEAPASLRLNQWALSGTWTDHAQSAELQAVGGKILFRFHARDLHLVLAPGGNAKPIRFRVRIDGKPPSADHGADTDAEGNGTVTEDRLYQLIRQHGPIEDHTFEIEFLDAGARAFAFTFG